ncbi:flagellar hook-length control protein FliK [Oricola cellulosilytica]|uniref:Flagellar hook-length control protein FliK n=1 Tax=Oricola cellulosilytica TaxID=1429082 RepID=A0A4V2MP42_9HYPH|nr:flagellar hook-length control protein FliK [Oricola cellulosilytica]TCD16212.1 flagellar hook-length control protein FliK [Oricola cellulosilytica]
MIGNGPRALEMLQTAHRPTSRGAAQSGENDEFNALLQKTDSSASGRALKHAEDAPALEGRLVRDSARTLAAMSGEKRGEGLGAREDEQGQSDLLAQETRNVSGKPEDIEAKISGESGQRDDLTGGEASAEAEPVRQGAGPNAVSDIGMRRIPLDLTRLHTGTALGSSVSPHETDNAPADPKATAISGIMASAALKGSSQAAVGTDAVSNATPAAPPGPGAPGSRHLGTRGRQDAEGEKVGFEAVPKTGAETGPGLRVAASTSMSGARPERNADQPAPDSDLRGAPALSAPSASSSASANGHGPSGRVAELAVPVGVVANGSPATAGAQVADLVTRELSDMQMTRLTASQSGAPGREVKILRLQLNPAELGAVNIRMQSVDGELRITIRADTDQAVQALARDGDAIRSALRAAGVTAADVSVGNNRGDQPSHQSQNEAFRGNGGQHEGMQGNRGEARDDSNRAYRSNGQGGGPSSSDGPADDGGNVRGGDARVLI